MLMGERCADAASQVQPISSRRGGGPGWGACAAMAVLEVREPGRTDDAAGAPVDRREGDGLASIGQRQGGLDVRAHGLLAVGYVRPAIAGAFFGGGVNQCGDVVQGQRFEAHCVAFERDGTGQRLGCLCHGTPPAVAPR